VAGGDHPLNHRRRRGSGGIYSRSPQARLFGSPDRERHGHHLFRDPPADICHLQEPGPHRRDGYGDVLLLCQGPGDGRPAPHRLSRHRAVDRTTFAIAALSITAAWLGGEIRAFFKLKIGLPLPPAPRGEQP